MSTSTLAAPIGDKILDAIPGSSGTPKIVNFASSRLNAIPEMIGCSMLSSNSVVMSVPTFCLKSSSNAPSSSLSKLDNTRKGTWYLPANSTARICNTLEPKDAISSISSKEIRSTFLAFGATRGSVV